jgi:hypothetical protein
MSSAAEFGAGRRLKNHDDLSIYEVQFVLRRHPKTGEPRVAIRRQIECTFQELHPGGDRVNDTTRQPDS